MRSVRIGAGQGFYGDTPEGAVAVAERGEVAYICCDALAELTMAILQKDRLRDPGGGFARDLPAFMRALLPAARGKGIRIITNAGGMNPAGAAAAVRAVAAELGIAGLRVATVTGDDITAPARRAARAPASTLRNMDTGADLADGPRPRRLRRRLPGRAPHRRRARGRRRRGGDRARRRRVAVRRADGARARLGVGGLGPARHRGRARPPHGVLGAGHRRQLQRRLVEHRRPRPHRLPGVRGGRGRLGVADKTAANRRPGQRRDRRRAAAVRGARPARLPATRTWSPTSPRCGWSRRHRHGGGQRGARAGRGRTS